MRASKDEDTEWLRYLESFGDEYDDRVYSNRSTGFVMRSAHKVCESYFHEDDYFSNVLEIGAGTGEHFHTIKHQYDSYTLSDSDAKVLEIAKESIDKQHKDNKAKYLILNASSLDVADESYDRVIASHILEHIYQPHLAIKEWMRVLKPGGVLSIIIPTDPGIAWKVGRHFTTRRHAKNRGWNYDYIMAREHVNPCNNLIALLKYYLPDNSACFWPLKLIPSIDCNLIYVFHATKSTNP